LFRFTIDTSQQNCNNIHNINNSIPATASISTRRPKPFSPPVTETIVWIFVVIGVLLRLRQFLFDRSLWLDESSLALNIIHRSPIELLSPLDYNQGAPLGFLLLEKFATSFLGTSEFALRLLPFVCGILSIFLFKQAASRFLVPNAVPVAVGLFSNIGSFDILLRRGEAILQRRCCHALVVPSSRFSA
jgi:hypothetical protein